MNMNMKALDLKFPSKLHLLLCQASEVGFEDIVSWSHHGKGFRIHDKPRFVDTILPMYFPGISQFKSFQRQLNLYGIHRGRTLLGNSCNWNMHTRFFDEYSHPSLIRENPGLAMTMTRPPSSRSQNATSTNPPLEQQQQPPNLLPSTSSIVSSVDTGSANLAASLAASERQDDVGQQLVDCFMQTRTTASQAGEKGHHNVCQDEIYLYDLLEPIPLSFPTQVHINSNLERMTSSAVNDLREEIITTFLNE